MPEVPETETASSLVGSRGRRVVRMELARGPVYVVNPGEQSASGDSLPFIC